MTRPMPRRVVTGLNPAGQSCVLTDAPARAYASGGGSAVWLANTIPADNATTADNAPADFSFDDFHNGGAYCFIVDAEPGWRSPPHTTDTLDYIVVMEGEVVLELDTGEATLRAGDVAVDRGVRHGWRNESANPARYCVITIPAHPVGAGRTV